MKALVFIGPSKIVYRDEPSPQPGAEDAVVRIRAAGICGSDLHAYRGHDSRRRPPIIIGHEAVGEVVSGPSAGRRVAIVPLVSCGHCNHCLSGRPFLCEAKQQIGLNRPGAFAEFIAVPVRNLIDLPDGLDWVDGALHEPTAVATRGVERVERAMEHPLRGARALVIGGGSIGLLSALLLNLRGCNSVSLAETNPLRRQMAINAGISDVFDPAVSGPSSGSPFELVVDAVGNKVTRRMSMEHVLGGGAILHLGLGDGRGGVDFSALTRTEITIVGSARSSSDDLRCAIDLLHSGKLGKLNWVEKRPLSAGAKAFADFDDGHAAAAKIVLLPDT